MATQPFPGKLFDDPSLKVRIGEHILPVFGYDLGAIAVPPDVIGVPVARSASAIYVSAVPFVDVDDAGQHASPRLAPTVMTFALRLTRGSLDAEFDTPEFKRALDEASLRIADSVAKRTARVTEFITGGMFYGIRMHAPTSPGLAGLTSTVIA